MMSFPCYLTDKAMALAMNIGRPDDPEIHTDNTISDAAWELPQRTTALRPGGLPEMPKPRPESNSSSYPELRPQPRPVFWKLPAELVHHILSYLAATDLACLSATCRNLYTQARDDLLWADLVNANLPCRLNDPGPFSSFRCLYVAHYPYWFVPRNKIWFSDAEYTGKLILARYDNRRGVIEGFRVVAEKKGLELREWEWNPNVMIETFHLRVRLWLDDPIILLKNAPSNRRQYLHGEIHMPMAAESQHVYSSFSLCARTNVGSQQIAHPNQDRWWPPENIPSDSRVDRTGDSDSQPENLGQISESAFRIRKWAHFNMGIQIFPAGNHRTMSTYGTLDQKLYTPTKEKPYQGIWVGDYSEHGCEFLLFLQPDRECADARTGLGRPVSVSGSTTSTHLGHQLQQTDLSIEGSSNDPTIERGPLEAIKLTGDLNIPRGQISFFAEEIGPNGLVRTADEEIFKGARIVRSRGHVASRNFRQNMYIQSQLILISHDRIAHYWEPMNNVSFFYRVDIDALLGT